MDDIHLDDPRKYSAKVVKRNIERAKKSRNLFQYLADLLIKTLIVFTIIALDFTLFANAGSYNLFASPMRLNVEAELIYAAIGIISFVIMFIVSFFRKLENVIISLVFAVTCVALVNQFATFEKQSALLMIFGGLFSDDVNTILYEYSIWIIAALAFVMCWMFMGMLKRSYMFYCMLGLVAVLAWVLSEAYWNTSSQYFKTVASSPVMRTDKVGKNLVFLSFNSLTSPNNLRRIAEGSKQQVELKKSFDNVLGFYMSNDFTLYPNALVKNPQDPFLNLIASYNPDSDKKETDHVANSVVKKEYFDFTSLQNDKMFLKDSSLYNMLRKDDYVINVYQTRSVDTCYLGSKLAVASCKEKINAPIAMNEGTFSTQDKVVLLVSQWLNSTGFVSSVNPLVELIGMVYPFPVLKPLNFDVANLYAINSFKVFDQIIQSIDRQSGNQAYFATIDLPSETYIYDEFCKLKNMSDWVSEKNNSAARISTDKKRGAYADQVSCLYGYLEKFMQQLEKADQLENTTVIIEGLNVPLGLNRIEQDYYRQLQSKNQVMLAIRPAKASVAEIDYSVCDVTDILNSFFFTKKQCKEFANLKTTDKNMKHIKGLIEEDKYAKHEVAAAEKIFDEWFKAWTAHNQFEGKIKNKTTKQEKAKVVSKAVVSEAVIEDVPEQKMKSLSVAADEIVQKKEIKQKQPDVIDIKKDAPIVIDRKELNKVANQPTGFVNSKIKTEQKVEDVIPEVLKETEEQISEKNSVIDDAIAKAKKAVEEKAKKADEVKKAENELADLTKSIETIAQDAELRGILEAPVAEGQNLSPEELKKQFHENLKKSLQHQDNGVNIKVNLIEN